MIKGFSEIRRCPRLGHIRLGIKKISPKTHKEYPAEVDYFILDPQTGDPVRNEELKKQFKQLYGEKPTAIKIMFPPAGQDLFFQQWYKRYGSSTLLKCKGNNETAICALPEFAEGLEVIGKDEMGLTKVKCLGPECPYQKDNSCNRLGALQVLLPELSGIGVWQINTGSWNSIVNLNSALDWLKGLCGRYHMIPVTLLRVPTDIPYEGRRTKHYIMQIDMHVSIAQLQKAALIAPEKAAIGALPAPDEEKDLLLYPEIMNGNNNNNTQKTIERPEEQIAPAASEESKPLKNDSVTNKKEPKTKKDYIRLAAIAKKELGETDYYSILNMWGHKHFKEIKSIERMEGLLQALRIAWEEKKQAIQKVKEELPEK